MRKLRVIILMLFPFCSSVLALPPTGTPAWQIAADIEEVSCIICSKLTEIIEDFEVGFAGTFTMLDNIINKELIMSSQLDTIQSRLQHVSASAFDSLISLACTIDSKVDVLSSSVDVLQERVGVPINNELVGTSGYTITTGGQYYLSENIFFQPSAPNLSAITINSDNVFLDLALKTLSTDATANTKGVEISARRANIQIRNGVIADTTGQGIYLNAGVNNVLIEDVTVLTDLVGVELASTATLISLNNVNMNTCASHGFLAQRSSNISLQNCTCSNNGTLGTGSGARFSNCFEVAVFNCLANNNANHGVHFVSTTTSVQITVDGCIAWDNAEHGILFEHVDGSIISNCFCKGNGTDGIHLADCVNDSVSGNCCESNGRDNIRLARLSTGTRRCYVGQNSLVLTTSVNLREDTGCIQNGIYGNFALANASADNYVSIAGGSFINRATVSQSGAFPATNPTFWNNISMTT